MELYHYLKFNIIKYVDLTIQGVYNYLDEVRNIILGQIDIQSFIYDDTDVNDYLNDISNNEDLNEYEDNKEQQEEDSSEYEDNK